MEDRLPPLHVFPNDSGDSGASLRLLTIRVWGKPSKAFSRSRSWSMSGWFAEISLSVYRHVIENGDVLLFLDVYYYYCLLCHSLCWCSFSAGLKACTWSVSHSSQSFCSYTKHLPEDSSQWGGGGGGGGTWVLFRWVCAARDSKLAPRSRKNFP